MKPNSLEPPTDATMQEWITIGPVCTVKHIIVLSYYGHTNWFLLCYEHHLLLQIHNWLIVLCCNADWSGYFWYMGLLWVTMPMIQYCPVSVCVCVESVFSCAFAQRKTTIADETHFCDPEILDKILKNKVREIFNTSFKPASLLH